MDVPARRRRLTLGVLGSFARPLEPVLLAFLHPGISREQAGLAQRDAMAFGIELEQCPRDAVTDRARLAGHPAPLDLDHYVEAALRAGHPERHPHLGFVDGVPEVLLEGTTVDHDL